MRPQLTGRPARRLTSMHLQFRALVRYLPSPPESLSLRASSPPIRFVVRNDRPHLPNPRPLALAKRASRASNHVSLRHPVPGQSCSWAAGWPVPESSVAHPIRTGHRCRHRALRVLLPCYSGRSHHRRASIHRHKRRRISRTPKRRTIPSRTSIELALIQLRELSKAIQKRSWDFGHRDIFASVADLRFGVSIEPLECGSADGDFNFQIPTIVGP